MKIRNKIVAGMLVLCVATSGVPTSIVAQAEQNEIVENAKVKPTRIPRPEQPNRVITAEVPVKPTKTPGNEEQVKPTKAPKPEHPDRVVTAEVPVKPTRTPGNEDQVRPTKTPGKEDQVKPTKTPENEDQVKPTETPNKEDQITNKDDNKKENVKKATKKSLKKATISSVKGQKKKITIKWKKVSGVHGYEIYRATSKNGKFKKVKTIKNASKTTYVNNKLKKGKKYYYKIRTYKNVNGMKVYGEYSSSKNAKVK